MYFFVDVCGVHHDLLVLTHASPTRRSSYLSDALETGGGARGRLDLDDEVDGPHVDAELEAAGGDHAAERARLELLLDLGPLLLRHRAVVRLGEDRRRSEEHTSELQSLMRTSYAVFCLKKKTKE